jgi:hypothetical protein
MIIIDMTNPWKVESVANAFCKLVEEVSDNRKEFYKEQARPVVKEWFKQKYNYEVEYILDEHGNLSKIQIDTDPLFFILKHG